MSFDLKIKVLTDQIDDELQRAIVEVQKWCSSSLNDAVLKDINNTVIIFRDLQATLLFDPRLCPEALNIITGARNMRHNRIGNSFRRFVNGNMPREARHTLLNCEWTHWVQRTVIETCILDHLVEELEETCMFVKFTETVLSEERAFQTGYQLSLTDVLALVGERKKLWFDAGKPDWPVSEQKKRKDSGVCECFWEVDCQCAESSV